MKEAELIQFKTKRVHIGDLRTNDLFRIAHHSDAPINHRVYNSHEFICDSVEIEDIPIRKIMENGVEHYIAVTHKVWEYLYYIENPVTAKSQEEKLKNQKGCIKMLNRDVQDLKNQAKEANGLASQWQIESMQSQTLYHELRMKVYEATVWQRIKWVFTGIK